MSDFTCYELTWPRDIFADELRAVLADAGGNRWAGRVGHLLTEAFADAAPREDFDAIDLPGYGRTVPSGQSSQWQFASELLVAAPTLRERSAPRPYWAARQRKQPGPALRDRPQVYRDFTALINSLQDDGYLEGAFPTPCVDAPNGSRADPAAELAQRLGQPDLWPLRPGDWDEDTFYGLVEVFHDLVARPRDRSWHDYGGCDWHYSGFAAGPARALYRWRVNRLLAGGGIELRLAESGEDAGRLVHPTDAGRTDLVERALASPQAGNDVAHAMALYRGRSSSGQDKRSAILTLTRILDNRRKLIKNSLFRRDEGALFRIANEFDLRHSQASQKSDYDEAFLDWIFWWYLATVELTDGLLARQQAAP